ncbi:MAG: RNA-binding protein [Planctomycetota bacterium]
MKLYVGNLPYSADERALQEFFEQIGEVRSAAVVMDRETGRSRGFGFVEMGSDEAGREAIEKMHGADMDGRQLVVNEARPREDRPRGGGGGYGGGGGGGYRGGGGGGGYRGGGGGGYRGGGGGGGYGGGGGGGFGGGGGEFGPPPPPDEGRGGRRRKQWGDGGDKGSDKGGGRPDDDDGWN